MLCTYGADLAKFMGVQSSICHIVRDAFEPMLGLCGGQVARVLGEYNDVPIGWVLCEQCYLAASAAIPWLAPSSDAEPPGGYWLARLRRLMRLHDREQQGLSVEWKRLVAYAVYSTYCSLLDTQDTEAICEARKLLHQRPTSNFRMPEG